MALIKCPDCGKEVSEYASECPSCGFPIRNCKFDIIVTEMDQTDEFSYNTVAKIMGDMAIANDAEQKLAHLPCILTSKNSKDKANKSAERLEQMGLKCEVQMNMVPETNQRSSESYITPEFLNIIADIMIAVGSGLGLIIWAVGSWNGWEFEWSTIPFIICFSMIFASVGTGIIIKFMAEVLNRLSK